MTYDREVHVRRDLNLGTLLPVLSLIVMQIVAGVWWGSRITSTQEMMAEDLSQWSTETAEQITSLEQTLKAENLRQWTRINQNESAIQSTLSDTRTNAAHMEALRDSMQDTRAEIRGLNVLLREILTRLPKPTSEGPDT